uniref:Small-subunit processome Utp12 domain-containing protein n=1 Tax=Kalanchoe fedtschenkoi TaxID=63787 RepID=A0A7N0UXC9_KALFE
MEDSGRKRSRGSSKSARKHRDKELRQPNHLGPEESVDGGVSDDGNEPTMGEKLEQLKLMEIHKDKPEKKEEAPAAPPTADSVHVLLKQALRADDRALLLDCIYNQDQKVIANTVSLLNSADVIKLLNSLLNIIQSRGAVLACALPWLKSLLLQHATGIMSQESSLTALNSLYQLIDSRVATYQSAMKVASCLDFVYAGIMDEGPDKEQLIIPVVYEDKSSEEQSEDDMETDDEDENNKGEASEGSGSDLEGNDVMSA